MKVVFRNSELEQMAYDPSYKGKRAAALVKALRKVLTWILQADSSRDLRTMKSLRFEKLKGKRKHQCSLRLNDQYRLIIELESADREQMVRIIDIEDYH